MLTWFALSLWNPCVPRDLLGLYRQWDRKYALGMSLSCGVGGELDAGELLTEWALEAVCS